MATLKRSRPKFKRTETRVDISGRELVLSNLGKPLFPSGFTKAQVIDYYRSVSKVMLPHLQNRSFTLKRYPEGTEGMFFYEKNCPAHRPDWVKIKQVRYESKRKGQTHIQYCVINDLPSLVWVANLASIEFHTLLSRENVNRPTMIAFDLDPGPGRGIVDCCAVALDLKRTLARTGLESFPKTSGSKGLHVYVPLNTPATFENTKTFARALALLLERQFPGRVTSNMSKALRPGKIFVDWSQNDDHKTTVAVYSLRAQKRPTVSTPVAWEEVQNCLRKKDPEMLDFEAPEVLARMEKQGDLFSPVLTLKQKLPAGLLSLP